MSIKYSKKRFDPFCRWDRIVIPYKDGNSIQTTIGQLNFFKWAIENLVLDYVEQNFDTIYEDMKGNNSKSQKNDQDEDELDEGRNRKRKTELSQSVHKTMCTYSAPVTLQFGANTLLLTPIST